MLSVEEQRKLGKKYRKEKVSRSALAEWKPVVGREEAKELIQAEEEGRIQKLIPLRHERMLASPFTFFRGAAVVQTLDLSKTAGTDLFVQACGDAHISNFGIFASPERRLIFDINDFDETLPAPFECDIKRLVASVEICGRDRSFSKQVREEAVLQAASVYRKTMLKFSEMGSLEVWYAHLDVETSMQRGVKYADEHVEEKLKKLVEKARAKDNERAIKKLTEEVDGRIQIRSNPPVLVPLRELAKEEQMHFERNIEDALKMYRNTLPVERRWIIDQYEAGDLGRKVVGVGSVGTRAWILVMEGAAKEDPLMLQIKEAGRSVLEKYYGNSVFKESGRRVVEGQRAIQTVSDVMLGWVSLPIEGGGNRDYYVRQLWDAKGSVDLDSIDETGLRGYAAVCGWTLAHAHARTGNRHMIAGYLGKGEAFEENMLSYAKAYADQNEADYEVCCRAWK